MHFTTRKLRFIEIYEPLLKKFKTDNFNIHTCFLINCILYSKLFLKALAVPYNLQVPVKFITIILIM